MSRSHILCTPHWYDDLIILKVLLRKLIIVWFTVTTTLDHVYHHVTDQMLMLLLLYLTIYVYNVLNYCKPRHASLFCNTNTLHCLIHLHSRHSYVYWKDSIFLAGFYHMVVDVVDIHRVIANIIMNIHMHIHRYTCKLLSLWYKLQLLIVGV